MGTKNNPGKFDCYANAEPDEPIFILLGRDRHAAEVVRYWVALRYGVQPVGFASRVNREERRKMPEKYAEALDTSYAMDEYRRDLGKAKGQK